MRDEIINCITMKDILDKYGIKVERGMYHCPFHTDKHASAKMYENSFYCFSCGKGGDIFKFVQYFFNLPFKEAMQKINLDFNLGLSSNTKIDYRRIHKVQEERKRKEQQKQKLINKYINFCKLRRVYCKVLNNIRKNININNWETLENEAAFFQDKINKIDLNLECLDKKISSSA